MNDEVRIKGVDAFNLDWLKGTYPSIWHKVKFLGTVTGHVGDKWIVKFPDAEEATLAGGKIEFVQRAEAEPVVVEESSEEDAPEVQPEKPMVDSSDEDGAGFFNEDPDHESVPAKTGKKTDSIDISAAWVRDDNFCEDQRPSSKTKYGPILNGAPDPAAVPLFVLIFELATKFLPMQTFMVAMAAKWTATGRAKDKDSERRYNNWTVTVSDLLQYIGDLVSGCTCLHFTNRADATTTGKSQSLGRGTI